MATVQVPLKFLGFSVHRSLATLIAEKNANQPSREFFCYLIQVHPLSRTRWALDCEIVAVIQVVHQQCADDEPVHGHPYWSSPVRVTSEHPRIGFCRKIRHAVVLASRTKYIGMLSVVARQRANAVRAQKLP